MSNILKGLNEGRNYGRDSWDSNMPGYQGDYGGAENFGRRNREWDEDDRIDARIRAEYEKKKEYEQNGKFWLKLKDSQRHLPAGPFIGKQAANTAAVELLKQQPELKGNLLITAYGPDETQGVAEGYSDEEHPIRDDGNEGLPGKQYYPGKLKLKGVAEGTTTNLDTDYYMNEGCGIFAVAMALNEPGSQIYIISNKSGESWSKSFPYEITHVFVNVPNKGQYDVHGQRSVETMANDFGLSKEDYVIKGPFDPKVFFTKFMSNSDSKPLYGTAKDVKELQKQIQNKQGVAEGLNEFAPDGFNGGDDNDADLYDLIMQTIEQETNMFEVFGRAAVDSTVSDMFTMGHFKDIDINNDDDIYNAVEMVGAILSQDDIAEGVDGEELANEVYAEFERIYPKLASRANQQTVHAAIMDVLNYGDDSNPSALAQDVARAVKRDIAQGVAEGQLDELSNNTLASYKKKAGADATQADKRGDYARGNKRMSGIIKATKKEFDNDAKGVNEEELDENLNKWFKEKWVRFGPDGKIRGDCARGDDSEGKPKCLPQSKAHSLGKKGRASAASRKRREDPNPERSGKAINVNTKKKSNESVSEEKKPDFMKFGNMKPFAVSGTEIPGSVSTLEKLLLKAKEHGIKLNYDTIDKMMQLVCKKYNLTGDELHNQFVQKHHMIPDDWIVKQLDEACWKGYHKEGNKKMFGKTYPNCVKNTNEEQEVGEDARIARKPGQPAGSKKHSDLYTDENPKGTITGLKFATAEDARASVSKIRNSGRSHAHKIQAAVAMEQRAKAAGKSEAASVYRKYINATKKTDEGIDLEEACWDTHKQVGMKNKGGKQVPNCVPKESIEESKESCPECGGPMFSDLLLAEKQDACYNKVKSRYKVWPSAYASGALVQCRKKGAANWGTGGKKNESIEEDQLDEKWTKKYKDSINCSNPKGFSQKAHCAGKKKSESAIMKGLVDEDLQGDK